MKKEKNFVKKLLAGFCAAALLFGALSCSSGSDDDDGTVDGGGSGGNGNQDGEVDISYKGPSSVPDLTITAPATAGTITMNGTTYDTIQAAFNAATAAGDYTITLTAGTYEEANLVYNGAGNIVISGVAGTTYGTDVLIKGYGDNTATSTEKTRCALEFIGTNGNSLVLENLSVQNTFSRVGDTYGKTQAEALGFDSTGTCAAYNCSFLSHQDTIRTVGKAWFYGCYIEGDVDFIWMEKAGKVALYENCAIKTVSDETTSAYIAAPGMTAAEVFNKGLVVYNSAVKAECADSYMFRNPWGVSESLYNIAAFVNVNVEGTLNSTLQKSTASQYGLDSNGAIGWKLDKDLSDSYSSKSSEINIISEAVEKAEYNGRTRIVNRVYKLNPEKYANDSDVWDVNSLASTRGWSVTTDASSLDSDESSSVKANGTYNIAEYATDTTQWASIADGSSTDGYVSWSGIVYHGTSYGAAVKSGSGTVSIQVAGASVISVMSSSYGNGTLTVTDSDGNVVLDSYSTKMATDKTAISFIYSGTSETTLTLTFTATSYIGTITVSAWDGEQQKVTKVAVSGDDAVTKDDTITLTATVTTQYCAPSTVTWTSSDESVATVSDSGVVTGVAAGEATITATSTFDTSKSDSITVSVTEVKSAKATWLDNTSASFVGASSDESIITVSDAVANTTKTSDSSVTGTYAYNSGKLSGEGVTLTTSDTSPARDDWYIEYPITAVKAVTVSKVSINWGNPGTGNCFAYVTYIDDEGTTVVDDSSVVARSTVNASSTFAVNKALAAGKSAKIRISLHGDKGSGSFQTFSGKAPTWGATAITVLEAVDESLISEDTFFDLRTLFSGLSTSGTASTGTVSKKLNYTAMYYKDTQHGAWFYKTSTLSFKVSGACTIYLGKDQYNGATYTVSDGTNSSELNATASSTLGTSVTSDMSDDSENPSFSYTGSGEATITISVTGSTSQNYLPALQVKF
ncbi:MAG: Ig-like domain-containing protein [Treponema sp.]|nr:Ig-like domain-containing protein [Treponema sp.]